MDKKNFEKIGHLKPLFNPLHGTRTRRLHNMQKKLFFWKDCFTFDAEKNRGHWIERIFINYNTFSHEIT